MTLPSHGAPEHGRSIASVVGWCAAAVAVLLTIVVVWMAASTISAWSSYESTDRQGAVMIGGFALLVTLLAWAIVWAVFSSRRIDPRSTRFRFVGGLTMALGAAAMFLMVEDVVIAVPITLLVVGIALIADDARSSRR